MRRSYRPQKHEIVEESDASQRSEQMQINDIYASPDFKMRQNRKDEFNIETSSSESDEPRRRRNYRPEKLEIIEESDPSQRSEPIQINDIYASPDYKSQQNCRDKLMRKSFTSNPGKPRRSFPPEKFEIIEESDESQRSAPTKTSKIHPTPNRKLHQSRRDKSVIKPSASNFVKPRRSREPEKLEIIEESDESQKPVETSKIHSRPDRELNQSRKDKPVKKPSASNRDKSRSFRQETFEIVESDESQKSEAMEISESQSNADLHSQQSQKEELGGEASDSDDPRRRSYRQFSEERDPSEIYQSMNYGMNGGIRGNLDLVSHYFDSEDSDSDCTKSSESEEETSDSDKEENPAEKDLEIDFIKADEPDTPKPTVVTAKVISTYTSDGLIYTELDNGIVVITTAKVRVKETGSLSYEEGSGVQFLGPSINNQQPRKFIACPQMAKEKLVKENLSVKHSLRRKK